MMHMRNHLRRWHRRWGAGGTKGLDEGDRADSAGGGVVPGGTVSHMTDYIFTMTSDPIPLILRPNQLHRIAR